MSNKIFDLYLIQSATERSKDYAKDTVARVQRYLVDDVDHERRMREGYCQWCWYRRIGGMYGQAFTEYTCLRCDEKNHHHNTGTPRLCKTCVEATKLCASCCGDINGKKRKKVP